MNYAAFGEKPSVEQYRRVVEAAGRLPKEQEGGFEQVSIADGGGTMKSFDETHATKHSDCVDR